MIDYNKLKLAHDMVLKTDCGLIHKVVCEHWNKHNTHEVFELIHPLKGSTCFECIDDVIKRLEIEYLELNQKPKHGVGQKIWWIDRHKVIRHCDIKEVFEDKSGYPMYETINGTNLRESEVFASKEDAINDRIDYWIKQLADELEPDIDKKTQEANKNSRQILGEMIDNMRKSNDLVSKLVDDGVKKILMQKQMDKSPVLGLTHCAACKYPLYECETKCKCNA